MLTVFAQAGTPLPGQGQVYIPAENLLQRHCPGVSGAEPRPTQPPPPEKWAPFLPHLLVQEAEPAPERAVQPAPVGRAELAAWQGDSIWVCQGPAEPHCRRALTGR